MKQLTKKAGIIKMQGIVNFRIDKVANKDGMTEITGATNVQLF